HHPARTSLGPDGARQGWVRPRSGPASEESLCGESQEEKVVAVTGDENPSAVTSADPASPDSVRLPTDSVRSPADGAETPPAESADTPLTANGAEAVVAPVTGAGPEPEADAVPLAEDTAADGQGEEPVPSKPSLVDLEQESEIAADYIEGLLDV